MRKLVLILLALAMVPAWTTAAPKHGKRLHDKLQELGHKKRLKQAAKTEPGAKKHLHN